jgi:FMN phosphatase YigB (HAD superfamily)
LVEDHSELSDVERRVRALETVLTQKGYIDPPALDVLIDTYQTKVGPRNGARVVARAWVDPAEFALRDRARVIVSGDTLAERKPHPAPLQYAADKLGVMPAHCIYIGDAERDVLAAQAAGMKVFVALFGYIPADERPRLWPASGWLDSPQAITELLDSLVP